MPQPPPSILGEYQVSTFTGAMAAGLASNSPILTFRNGSATAANTSGVLAIVRSIVCEGFSATTGFTAGDANFKLLFARSFTANDTGGAALTLTGNNAKLRTATMPTTAIIGGTTPGEIRQSATAALTAGTRVLDANPLGSLAVPVTASTNVNFVNPGTVLFQAASYFDENPLVLAKDEGFTIQATVPATGVWSVFFRIHWAEALSA